MRNPGSGDAGCQDDAVEDLDAMALALDLAWSGDVPVGAVVLIDGEVVAEANQRESTGDPTAHAEVLALRAAAATLGRWRLDDATLVVTLEPCAMCAGARWAPGSAGSSSPPPT